MDREREKIEKAVRLFREADAAGAERLLKKLVDKSPTHVEALYLLGVVLHRSGRPQEAIRYLTRATRAQPGDPELHNTLGAAFYAANRTEDAIDSLTRAISLSPTTQDALVNRASLYVALGRFDEAVADGEAVVKIGQDSIVSYLRLAEIHILGGAPERALAVLDVALSVDPASADAHCFRGNVLSDLERFDEAIAAYDRAIASDPTTAGFYLNKAQAYVALGRCDAALLTYDLAIALAPGEPDAYVAKAELLRYLNRLEESFALFNKALALDPRRDDALAARGANLLEAGFLWDALRDYEKVAELRGDENHLIELRGFIRRKMCDWSLVPDELGKIEDNICKRKEVASAFAVLSISNSEAVNLNAAKLMSAQQIRTPAAPLAIPVTASSGKIKVAYFSADFHDHATAHLLASVLEYADKENFEVIGLSFGPDSQDAYRARIKAAFDTFFDVRSLSDDAVVRLARQIGVDIAVDLKGLTKGHRIGIFAGRAAPTQVNYLGYPASVGADCMDYVVADRTVISDCNRGFLVEKIIHLPDAYQPNDPDKTISDRDFTRAKVGLPDDAFVYCCFNNSYKILPEVFDVWMRVLRQVPRSVMWLITDNEWAPDNLRREAERRGVAGQRLVFSPRVPLAEHLARHRLADLFLDTLPYNAHTTASDALLMGVPVLTCVGQTIAGRVAASLLMAAGLPELITRDLSQYEAIAIEVAAQRDWLERMRTHLRESVKASALFDARRYARNLEKAFAEIHRRHTAGLAPDHIYIEA